MLLILRRVTKLYCVEVGRYLALNSCLLNLLFKLEKNLNLLYQKSSKPAFKIGFWYNITFEICVLNVVNSERKYCNWKTGINWWHARTLLLPKELPEKIAYFIKKRICWNVCFVMYIETKANYSLISNYNFELFKTYSNGLYFFNHVCYLINMINH